MNGEYSFEKYTQSDMVFISVIDKYNINISKNKAVEFVRSGIRRLKLIVKRLL